MNSKQDRLPHSEIVQEYRNGQTVKEISLFFGVSDSTIRKILTKNGVKMSRGRPKNTNSNTKRFRSSYMGRARYEMRLNGMRWKDIGSIFNVSRQAVFMSAKEYAKAEGKKWPPINKKIQKDTTAIEKKAYRLHENGDIKKTWDEIGRIMGLSASYARNAAEKHAKKNNLAFPVNPDRKTRSKMAREQEQIIRKNMYESGMTVMEIAQERGVSYASVYFGMINFGIKMRKPGRRSREFMDRRNQP